MDEICVSGGIPLHGEIEIQGSKNAALPMMAAALLYRGISVLEKCPKIADIFCMEEILQSLGADTWWEEDTLYLDCTNADGTEINSCYTGRMRSSIILLGALLGRNGQGKTGYPGGCVIGKRPVDLHIKALQCLGAKVEEEREYLKASAGELKGGEIFFTKKSVGATQQAVLASVLAKGKTVIRNPAEEPEILWLCRYLEGMGACISGAGTARMEIQGVKNLKGGMGVVPPDRIVTGTYLFGTAATRGKITIVNPPKGEMDAFLEVYGKMGGQYEWNSGKLVADASGICYPVSSVETGVYPGFPTDLQSPLMAVLATVPGKSRIRENVFEDRFRVAEELNRMGASVHIEGQTAWITGRAGLHGTKVQARELRGGAALVIAALAAEGETIIKGCSFIRRGYENICRDLSLMGAQIRENTGNIFYENIQLQEKNRNKW